MVKNFMDQRRTVIDKKTPNQSVLNLAYQFHYVAENATGPNSQWDVYVAKMVNYSFALELYLKAFTATKIGEGDKFNFECGSFYNYEYVTTNVKTHKMSGIFDAISQEDKDELQSAYVAKNMTEFYATLQDAISRFDDVFVTYRYVFECRNKGIETKLLFHLLNFFKEFTLNKLR